MGKHCVMIAGGEFDVEFASSYIKDKYGNEGPELFIIADHGLDGMAELEKRNPDMQADLIVVGDYDSVEPGKLQKYRERPDVRILRYPPEKNYTDSHLALYTALEEDIEEITILGATGTRIDHMLANLGLLQICMEKGVAAELVDAHNRIHMIDHELRLEREKQFGTYVSLIPYTELVTGVTLTGMKYPLEDYTFHIGIAWEGGNKITDNGVSRGISNEIEEEEALIQMKTGSLLVIESRD